MTRDKKPYDFLLKKFGDAVEDSPFDEPLFDHLLHTVQPDEKTAPYQRYGISWSFLGYAMGLSAFGHPKAHIAFQACEQWARLCLEVADEPLAQYESYYCLSASAWLQTGTVPEELVSTAQQHAVQAENVPDTHPFKWRAKYSFAHALAGDWVRAQESISKGQNTRPVALNTRGAMSPAQSLLWGYQCMAVGGPVDKRPEQFILALHKHLRDSSLHHTAFPWLYLYRLLFAPTASPVALLHLMRPGAAPL